MIGQRITAGASVEEIVAWAFPMLAGRSSAAAAQLLDQALTECKVPRANVDAAISHVEAKLAAGARPETDRRLAVRGERIASAAALLSASSRDEWDAAMCDRTAMEMDALGRLVSRNKLPITPHDKTCEWSREHDMHLLIGVTRFGLSGRALDCIAADPALIFARRAGPRARASFDALRAAEKENENSKRAAKNKAVRDRRASKDIALDVAPDVAAPLQLAAPPGGATAVAPQGGVTAVAVAKVSPLPEGPASLFLPAFPVLVKRVVALLEDELAHAEALRQAAAGDALQLARDQLRRQRAKDDELAALMQLDRDDDELAAHMQLDLDDELA